MSLRRSSDTYWQCEGQRLGVAAEDWNGQGRLKEVHGRLAIICTSLQMLLFFLSNRKREHRFPIKHLDKSLLDRAMQCSNAYILIDDEQLTKEEEIKERGSISTISSDCRQKNLPMTDEEAKVFWGLTHLTDKQFVELGDRHPGWRYII